MIHVSGVVNESIVDGEGIRTTIFVSGCKHRCVGCHNPLTHDFKYGKAFTIKSQYRLIDKIKSNPLLEGITISGGDSMFNAIETFDFVSRFKVACPNMTIWIYSGFTYEEIVSDNDKLNLLRQCDVLVDGRYVESKKDLSLKFKGSYNQRVIDIQESLNNNKIVLYNLK